MVSQARGYYGAPFKLFIRLIQRYPLYPTIFNVVVYAVIQHWVTVVAATEELGDPGAANTEDFGREVQWLVAYFNEEYRLYASTR